MVTNLKPLDVKLMW